MTFTEQQVKKMLSFDTKFQGHYLAKELIVIT